MIVLVNICTHIFILSISPRSCRDSISILTSSLNLWYTVTAVTLTFSANLTILLFLSLELNPSLELILSLKLNPSLELNLSLKLNRNEDETTGTSLVKIKPVILVGYYALIAAYLQDVYFIILFHTIVYNCCHRSCKLFNVNKYT